MVSHEDRVTKPDGEEGEDREREDAPIPTDSDWEKVMRRPIQPQEEPVKDQGDPLTG